MNVRTLCLAILHHQDATGYEIRKLSTDGRYAYFVDASFGSIYPALAKLEDEGLVSCRLEQQDGKPSRKVYSMNDAGREVLRGSLRESPTPDIFRSEFLLIAMCADLLDTGDMENALNIHIEQVDAKLAKIDDMACDLPCDSWLPDFGRTCVKAHKDFLVNNRQRILDNSAKIARDAKPTSSDMPPTISTAAE